MTECYFCSNHIIELFSVMEIGGNWTTVSEETPDSEFACEHCIEERTDSGETQWTSQR